jgi:hypothetical protein
MRDDVKGLNLRSIEYYTPYSRQVLPRCRNTTRMNPKLSVEEDFLWENYLDMEDYKYRMVS